MPPTKNGDGPGGDAQDDLETTPLNTTLPQSSFDVDGQTYVRTPAPRFASVEYRDIAREFSILGFTAFGDLPAVGYFQKRFVDKLRWLSASLFVELFALGNCLPGSTSSQLAFSLGLVKKGLLGGLLSGVLFQLPGAILMTCLGLFSESVLQQSPSWMKFITSGLSAAGVALVASSTKNMMVMLCNEKLYALVCTMAACATIIWPYPWMFALTIFMGGLVTVIASRTSPTLLSQPRNTEEEQDELSGCGVSMGVGALLFLLWLALLVVLLVLVGVMKGGAPLPLQWMEVFYKTGSIIFGGGSGQVALPLLLNDLVSVNCTAVPAGNPCPDADDSWVGSQEFFFGLAMVQAIPGPLLNLSAYLGVLMAQRSGVFFMGGAALTWTCMFLPSVLIMFSIIPYWTYFRKIQLYQRALPGLSSAGVGLIVAALFKMALDVHAISPFPTVSLCTILVCFTLVDQFSVFEPIVIISGGVLGLIAWMFGLGYMPVSMGSVG